MGEFLREYGGGVGGGGGGGGGGVRVNVFRVFHQSCVENESDFRLTDILVYIFCFHSRTIVVTSLRIVLNFYPVL